ncbi:porin family protein [Cellulophaga sp. 20_2_10]|uniref:porin family protein n=1 Tax=Cellulophaga sp. 20_2_10 TaxID=2942476 RepID=UPI00201B1B71|nr:porin family protein [Cellulophaga sp. 20_2_10]MCL5247434.1 porin family protein [Cellulophaga sp. 20_2_10]
MKKLFIVAITALGFTFAAQAQEDGTIGGFEQGDVFIEGTLGFGSTNDKNTDEKSNGFNFTPKVGFLLNDDFALGAQLDFRSSKTEVGGTDTSEISGFGAGVFGRYYFLDLGQRFKTYTELGFAYNSAEDKLADVKANGFGAGLDLGLNYFVKENIALTFTLDNLVGYSSTKLDVSGAKASSEFNFGIGEVNNPFGGTANFGILFVF